VIEKFEGPVKDLYGTLVTTRNFEIGLFWQRSNYFLVLNTAIALGFFNVKEGKYGLMFVVMGIVASLLWFWVCLGSKYWQTRWERRLMDFENHHLNGLNFFAADPSRIRNDVERGLAFHPSRGLKGAIYALALNYKPSVSFSMILLAGLFTVAWLVAGVFFVVKLAQP